MLRFALTRVSDDSNQLLNRWEHTFDSRGRRVKKRAAPTWLQELTTDPCISLRPPYFPTTQSAGRRVRDRCNRRILCRVITWRRGLSGIHQNGAGCGDGEITRCGEGEVLAGGDSAAGSQWPGNEAVLCPGGDFRTPVLLVATNPASARSAPSPSVGGRRGGGLGP